MGSLKVNKQLAKTMINLHYNSPFPQKSNISEGMVKVDDKTKQYERKADQLHKGLKKKQATFLFTAWLLSAISP